MAIGSQTPMTVIWVSWSHLEPVIEFLIKLCKFFGKAMNSFLPVMLFMLLNIYRASTLICTYRHIDTHRHTYTQFIQWTDIQRHRDKRIHKAAFR